MLSHKLSWCGDLDKASFDPVFNAGIVVSPSISGIVKVEKAAGFDLEHGIVAGRRLPGVGVFAQTDGPGPALAIIQTEGKRVIGTSRSECEDSLWKGKNGWKNAVNRYGTGW